MRGGQHLQHPVRAEAPRSERVDLCSAVDDVCASAVLPHSRLENARVGCPRSRSEVERQQMDQVQLHGMGIEGTLVAQLVDE